jgi:hypothetical protein
MLEVIGSNRLGLTFLPALHSEFDRLVIVCPPSAEASAKS